MYTHIYKAYTTNHKTKANLKITVCTVDEKPATIHIPGGTAGEEDHLVLLLVEEEIVERPQTSVLAVGVGVQIRVVTGARGEKNHFASLSKQTILL